MACGELYMASRMSFMKVYMKMAKNIKIPFCHIPFACTDLHLGKQGGLYLRFVIYRYS